MARPKQTARGPKHELRHHRYTDHAGQPAALLKDQFTHPEEVPPEDDWAEVPQLAFQVYSTIPLDPDHTALYNYLSTQIDFWPQPCFEIYAPQPDAFACVEHQRREIAHRKRFRPGDEFFPGIAKIVPDDGERLPQGLLIVIRSDSYRQSWAGPNEKEGDGTCPLWVTFNRCFPQKTEVDVRSRYTFAPPYARALIPHVDQDEDLSLERSETVVVLRNAVADLSCDLKYVFNRSRLMNSDFDYGFDEDEGQPYDSSQPISPRDREAIDEKAESSLLDGLTVSSPSDGTVTITTPSAVADPDLQYIIHVSFPHSAQDLEGIARAFTSTMLENLPTQKSIYFGFRSSRSSIGHIVNTHREIVNTHPGMKIGAIQTVTLFRGTPPQRQKMRLFPSTRRESSFENPWFGDTYKTFIVILDRPDFLAGPGVLFLLADPEPSDEYPPAKNPDTQHMSNPLYSPRNPRIYQAWRSMGMPAVARRLAMLVLEESRDEVTQGG
ncbi:hypothetical protein ASPWEDRAFT_188133 [Aspergillus wentii DTO 134E9]|uniref:Uncharacterized protein n=1 Tax=Aspergillus wentii DTO 134E9 TaxID=1073089 RepID=A0A1L9R443_ASPWE|nr:uncharacterized protein ASPWEDRAFT_188133 [Aspergillus wentii DTO 134E9]KAI9926972.1 hypothetical protein MW887_003352 [Aspergillus wentii]OJJ29686.1 hypothetical protein ASPWEDRAFT_188133 [Aspergillus wentii DTO 134E9]